MKISFIAKTDANWSTDGRWQTPTGGVEPSEGAGRPRFRDHHVVEQLKLALSSKSQAMENGGKIKDFPEEIAFLWAAGYAPSQAQKIFTLAINRNFTGSHHTFASAYCSIWPTVFNGETEIPLKWLDSIRKTGHGPWSDSAPQWFRSFFDMLLATDEHGFQNEVIASVRIDSLPPELLKTAKLIEALRIHKEAQPDNVSDEMVLNALGPPFKIEEEPDDWDPSSWINRKQGHFKSQVAIQMENASKMIESGIPLSVALALNDLPLPYDVGNDDFHEMQEHVFSMGKEGSLEELRIHFSERLVGLSGDPDNILPTAITLQMPPEKCFPDLVPVTNEEIEPLIDWYVVESALFNNGGAPYLNNPSKNIILRVVLEIMAEIYYSIDPSVSWETGFRYADTSCLPMQPIRNSARTISGIEMPYGFQWIPYFGLMRATEIQRLFRRNDDEFEESTDHFWLALKAAMGSAKKPPEIPSLPIVDLSDPKVLETVFLTGDVSPLWSWKNCPYGVRQTASTDRPEISRIRTKFNFYKFNRKIINSTIRVRTSLEKHGGFFKFC